MLTASRVAENRQIRKSLKSTKEILRTEFRSKNKTGQQKFKDSFVNHLSVKLISSIKIIIIYYYYLYLTDSFITRLNMGPIQIKYKLELNHVIRVTVKNTFSGKPNSPTFASPRRAHSIQ